ncbi:MAG: DUF421 domain-containing protein [Acetobacteraceae bacterium]|nr:DUF421 domain-containing protein [Acetobacteraceae bacterium]
MFFDGWSDIGRILAVGALGYAALVALLRVSGKRTLAKLNAFDLVVTVALGSTLSSLLLDSTVSLSEGLAALALLVGLQFAVAWSAMRWPPVSRLVKSEPTLLLHRGQVLDGALRIQRVTREEVQAALRSAGLAGPEQALAVTLETDGSLSVVPAERQPSPPGTVAPPP